MKGSRRFSARQKQEAWTAQDGRCAWCNEPLAEPMDGHHELRWEAGGATDDWNCKVVHPECHREMGASND
jgi:hypothetical protein